MIPGARSVGPIPRLQLHDASNLTDEPSGCGSSRGMQEDADRRREGRGEERRGGGRGEEGRRGACLLFLTLLTCWTGSAKGQCNGSPQYLTAGNSSGHVAFPELNFDPTTGSWQLHQFYPTAVKCSWVLRAPPGHVLAAAFLHFDTEQDYDFVTIYGSEARTGQLLRVSGDLTSDWLVTSPGDTLVIDFISDGYTTYYGFLLAYRYQPRACVDGGVTVTEDHLIALPTVNLRGTLPGPRMYKRRPGGGRGHERQVKVVGKGGAVTRPDATQPDLTRHEGSWVPVAEYPPWVNCTWRVAVDPRSLVHLEVRALNTADKDVLTVWEMGVEGARVVRQYSGRRDPPFQSLLSSRPLVLTFRGVTGQGGAGFLIDLSYVTRACDPAVQEVTAPRGLVAYPRYNLVEETQQEGRQAGGDGKWRSEAPAYYGRDACRWLVRAREGYVLNLTMLHLDTRPQDTVQVEEDGEVVLRLAGNELPKSGYVSSGSQVTVTFTPPQDTDRTGFLLQYAWVLKECGGEVEAGSGEVRSPYYPAHYGPDVTCSWTFTPPPGHLLHLQVTRLHLDQGDALQVRDGVRDVKVRGEGSLLSLTPRPSATLYFSSDTHHSQGYFLIKYTSFRPGSCDFTLSPCGWVSTDPLQTWTFHVNEHQMEVAEGGAGAQLPRGYRALLTSPWVTPPPDQPASLNTSSGEPTCLRFSYLLDGPDAFLLSVWMVEKQVEEGKLRTSPLLHLYGPHGNRSLTAAVNFTVTADFKVVLQYERGYGPHYRVGVGAVWVGRGRRCGRDLEYLRRATCDFTSDLCGWRNTHDDHKNWVLGVTGVRTEVRGGSQTLPGQWADLLSPPLPTPIPKEGGGGGGGDEVEEVGTGGEGQTCLHLHYRFLSTNAELRVILRRLSAENSAAGPSAGSWRLQGAGLEGEVGRREEGREKKEMEEEEEEEEMIWKQGRVKSPGVLQATIILPKNITRQHQLVLRGVGVGGVGVVEVVRVWVGNSERCEGGLNCTLDAGFCSWGLEYQGDIVWYPHHSQDGDGGHAAVLTQREAGEAGETDEAGDEGEGGKAEEKTSLVSETVSVTNTPAALSFRYKLTGTIYCLSVGQRVIGGGAPSNTTTTTTLWRQCRGKGDHWLTECVTLPPSSRPYQVVVGAEVEGSDGGEENQVVWLDDLHFSPGLCDLHLHTGPLEDDLDTHSGHDLDFDLDPVWECLPRGSLCGLTQPWGGGAPWVYVEAPRPADTTTTTAPTMTTMTTNTTISSSNSGQYLKCDDGTVVQETWVCDGIPDCPDHSDEKECECEAGEGVLVCGGAATPEPHLDSGLCGRDAFHCPSGVWCGVSGCEGGAPPAPCLSRSKVCDGTRDCRGGEDEAGCLEGTDVQDSGEGVVRCSGGLVLPPAWRCDGRKDCPLDGLDEVGCGYCGPGEYICPLSGVCVPREQVCDGAPSLPSCTDELYCHTCPPAHLACDVCVTSWQICDGVWDCEGGADERNCMGVGVVAGGVEGGETCPPDAPHQCRSGHCLPDLAICDRRVHCPQGEDELDCEDDNHEVTRYLSVVGSGGGDDLSVLVTPPLPRPPGTVGVLTFLFRLDAWIGPSNLTLSLEEVSTEEPSLGVRQWAVWRQSGHKGKHWLKETVLLPPLPTLTSIRLAFLASQSSPGHASPQLHVARLAYRAVPPHDLEHVGLSRVGCEFAGSLCGWSQPSSSDGYSWNYASSSPHARRTGPITGYPDGGDSGFVFADSLYGKEGSVADLVSPPLLLHPHHALCFRLAMFLYGSQVAKVSVLAAQHLPPHTHTHTLYTAKGGRGLSWVPVGVTVRADQVREPEQPFVVVVRAVRGRGTEGDIALDHLTLTPGPCTSTHPPDPALTLQPALLHPHAHALTAGPALTPQRPAPTHAQPHRGPKRGNPQASEDPCAELATCTDCVTSAVKVVKPGDTSASSDVGAGLGMGVGVGWCVWCDLNQRCTSPDSPVAAACPPHLSLAHNTSRGGEIGCPQLAPGQQSRVLVAAGGSALATFPVTNIQAAYTDRGWICVLERVVEEAGEEKGAVAVEEEAEEERRKEEEAEGKEDEDGGDFDFKKRRRKETRRKESLESVRLPGQFKGQIVESGDGESVGVGVIRCGEGVDEVWPIPLHLHAHPTHQAHDAQYRVRLLTPAGTSLDNTGDVRVVVSQCNQLVSTCLACLALNTSCAWCPASLACLPPPLCPSSTWVDARQGCEVGLGEAGVGGAGLGTGEPLQPLEDDPDTPHPSIALSPNEEEEEEKEEEEEEAVSERRRSKRRKSQRARKEEEEEGEEEVEEEEAGADNTRGRKQGRVGGKKRSGKRVTKGKMKVTGRGRAFLRLPQHPGLYVARDAWRLHTGRQYYIPVSRKSLINLGFVRQVTFGSLAQEKARTVLVNGAWKKAAGYFVDLYEKVGQDPVTSLITTSRTVFEQIISQLSQDQ